MPRVSMKVVAGALFALLWWTLGSCMRQAPPKSDASYGRGGQSLWIGVPAGRLKAEAFSSPHVGAHPVLLVVLHGDLPDPTPSYQYAFAQLVTQGVNGPALPETVRRRLADWKPLQDIVAVGLLRPGYADNAGDRSDGDMGNAALDNFTPEVVDAIAVAVDDLRKRFGARRVVLVGHSGGAAIVADILGRHTGTADAALLVGCGCDPDAERAEMSKVRGNPIWKGPTRSLQPMALVPNVRADVVVLLIVGEKDDTAPPVYSLRYAQALKNHGIDAQVTVVPTMGHNILLTVPVLTALTKLVLAK
jgi:pimeloyl-ACP methyl ester carboxylesterase